MSNHLWNCRCFQCRPSRDLPPRSGPSVAGDPSFDRAKAAVESLAAEVTGEKKTRLRKRK